MCLLLSRRARWRLYQIKSPPIKSSNPTSSKCRKAWKLPRNSVLTFIGASFEYVLLMLSLVLCTYRLLVIKNWLDPIAGASYHFRWVLAWKGLKIDPSLIFSFFYVYKAVRKTRVVFQLTNLNLLPWSIEWNGRHVCITNFVVNAFDVHLGYNISSFEFLM